MSRTYRRKEGEGASAYVQSARTQARARTRGRFQWVLVLGQHSRDEVTPWSSEPMARLDPLLSIRR